MGLYSPTVEAAVKVNYVNVVARTHNLPAPKYDADGNFARLTKDEVDKWIYASHAPDASKHLYLIGFLFEKYKYQCIIPKDLKPGEPDHEDADYSIVFD